MKRPIADYVALSLVGNLSDSDDVFGLVHKRDFKGSWDELKTEAEKRCGFEVSQPMLRDAVRALAACGLVRVSEDPYAGEYVKIYPDRFKDFVRGAREENSSAEERDELEQVLTKPSDYPRANALASHPVFEDYAELEDEWLQRALDGLRDTISGNGSLTEHFSATEFETAPAADRIVTFSDNEVSEFESQTNDIIESVEGLNSIGEQVGFRELILGQLKAGREFIRAGCVKAYLLQITLIDTLKFLAKRYEKEAIGALASALLAALNQHLGLVG